MPLPQFTNTPLVLSTTPPSTILSMASISFSVAVKTIFQSNSSSPLDSNHRRYGFLSNTTRLTTTSPTQDSHLVRVATEPSVVVPSPITTENYNEKKLAAWKSIRQERWEGEMNVEGEIPLWLVRKTPSSL